MRYVKLLKTQVEEICFEAMEKEVVMARYNRVPMTQFFYLLFEKVFIMQVVGL